MSRYQADVDSEDNDKRTALHTEAEKGHEVVVVQLLLEHTYAEDGDGWIALFVVPIVGRGGDAATTSSSTPLQSGSLPPSSVSQQM